MFCGFLRKPELYIPKSFVGVERLSYVLKSLSNAFSAVNSSRVSLLGGRANLKRKGKNKSS